MKKLALIVGQFFLVFGMTGAVVPAYAQLRTRTPQVEIGYRFLETSSNGTSLSFPLGFDVGACVPVIPHVGIVADVAWAHESQTVVGIASTQTATTFGVGARYTHPVVKFNGYDLNLFAQGLIGGQLDSIAVGSLSNSQTSFMLQPGVGVLVPLSNRFTALGELDYRRVFSTDADNDISVRVGVTFKLGSIPPPP